MLSTKKSFSLSILLGFLIWFLSPYITGKKEPWDSNSLYYISGLFISGLIPAYFCKEKFWLYFIGVYLGQLSYNVILVFNDNSIASLFPLGIISLLIFSLFSLLGSFIGSKIPIKDY